MTLKSPSPNSVESIDFLAEVEELAGRLGTPPSLEDWQSASINATALATESLSEGLKRCRIETISMREWPAILQAWNLSQTGKSRELIALDETWAETALQMPHAEASFRVGQRQLHRLRALRDQRFIARYLEAIRTGNAHGWHPIVYGVFLAVFHLPLRQGLVSFGTQTLLGFARAASRQLSIREDQLTSLLDAECALLHSSLPPLPNGHLFQTA